MTWREKSVRYRFVPMIAVLLTAIIALIVMPLKGTKWDHIHRLLLDARSGVLPSIFISIYIVGVVLVAHTKRDYRSRLIMGLFAFALMPILLGFCQTLINVTIMLTGYADFLTQSPTSAQITAVQRNILFGTCLCLDSLFVGVLTTTWTYPSIFSLCMTDPAHTTKGPNKRLEATGETPAPQP